MDPPREMPSHLKEAGGLQPRLDLIGGIQELEEKESGCVCVCVCVSTVGRASGAGEAGTSEAGGSGGSDQRMGKDALVTNKLTFQLDFLEKGPS